MLVLSILLFSIVIFVVILTSFNSPISSVGIDCSIFPRLKMSDISPDTFIGWFVLRSQTHETVLDHACFWGRFYSEAISSKDGISFKYFYNIEFTTEFMNLFWYEAKRLSQFPTKLLLYLFSKMMISGSLLLWKFFECW